MTDVTTTPAADAVAPNAAPAPTAAPAPPAGPLTTTLTLLAPIKGAAGETITTITLTEQTLSSLKAAERSAPDEASRGVAVLAALTGLAPGVAQTLRLRDMTAINGWRTAITKAYIKPGSDPLADDGERTFDLLVPLKSGAASITQITLQEPTVAAGVAVSKYKTLAAQDAALLAAVSGLSIIALGGLVERDIVRLKAWLGPFVIGSDSATEPDGEI